MRGYKPVTKPQMERLDRKMQEAIKDIGMLSVSMTKEKTVDKINRINMKIRGLINYYSAASQVNLAMSRYSMRIMSVAYNALRRKGVKRIPACEVSNLLALHKEYKTKIPAIPIGEGKYIGITSAGFCRYQKTYSKNPNETPYTSEGRTIHRIRVKKQMTLPRMEEILQSSKLSVLIGFGAGKKIYNLEYFLNRMYALNRDRMRYRVCGEFIIDGADYHAHHIRKNLPLSEVNRVGNLASTHAKCHKLIHSQISPAGFSKKTIEKAEKFKEKLLD